MTELTSEAEACKECAAPLTPKTYGPKPTYCSAACRSKAAHKRVKADGRYQDRLRKATEKRIPISHQLTCHQCEDTFTGKRRDIKYCSQLCASRAFNAARKADGRLKAYREQAADQRKTWMVENRSRYQNERHCEVCETAFTTIKYRPTRFCSAECSAWDQREQAGTNVCQIPDIHPVLSSRIPDDHPCRPRRSCKRCTATFVITWSSKTYCTERCQRRAHSSRRDARMRGAYVADVSPIAIYMRDEWRCHLCEGAINRLAEVPHPLAPTIDHVIPLAKGGTHEPDNVAAAHFLCNATKGDRDVGALPMPAVISA